MNRCIIIGAMNHASGGENRKLPTMTAGIQKQCMLCQRRRRQDGDHAAPKTTALTIVKISVATRKRVRLALKKPGAAYRVPHR